MMWSFPAPPGTISANTCWKCSFTRSSVWRMAVSFCSSTLRNASAMAASPASTSSFRRRRSASCSEKFSYCSTALRLTCWKAARARITSARSLMSCAFGRSRRFSTSAIGALRIWSRPSTSVFFCACAFTSARSWSTRRLAWAAWSWRRCSSAASSSRATFAAAHSSARACKSLAAASAPSEASRCWRSSRLCRWTASSARSRASCSEPRAASVSSSCSRVRMDDSSCASFSSREARRLFSWLLAASCAAVSSCSSEVMVSSFSSSLAVRPLSFFEARSFFFASMDASHSPIRTSIRCFHSRKSLTSREHLDVSVSRPWTSSVRRCISTRTRSRASSCARRSPCSVSIWPDVAWTLSSISGSFSSASRLRACADRIDSARARRTKRCGSW
mmetsp:Transcript_13375/g.38002  ORF Transcript_13375/g.38002 Transcript_13375/m.38002 type:complete len:390 (+) Transcript_13375:544-1713(+)